MNLFWKSFTFAGYGLWFCIRHERNFRIHLVVTAYVLAFAPSFSLSRAEWAALILTLALVLAAEAINTAVEHTVDLSSPDIHPTARIAKDTAAAAVLVCASASIIIGIVLLYRPDKLLALWNGLLEMPWKLALAALSVVFSLAFIIKGGPAKPIPPETGRKNKD